MDRKGPERARRRDDVSAIRTAARAQVSAALSIAHHRRRLAFAALYMYATRQQRQLMSRAIGRGQWKGAMFSSAMLIWSQEARRKRMSQTSIPSSAYC